MVTKLESRPKLTLRELVCFTMDTGNWNRVFSVIYDTYYTENDSRADVDICYTNVLRDLVELAPDDKLSNDHDIVIEECTTVVGGRGHVAKDFEKYINVRLEQHDGSPFSICMIPWPQLQNMKVRTNLDLTPYEQLAHIAWEISFDGFTNDEVVESIGKFEQTVKDAENSDFIEWKDVKDLF